MANTVNFSGFSGGSFTFEQMKDAGDWARVPGIVLFAAPEGRGWRAISVSEQGGVDDDIGAFWRWREACRYGATAVFVRRERDVTSRRRALADLAAGLDPVCAADCEDDRIAA